MRFIFEILIYVFFAWVMYTFAMKSYAYSQNTGITDKPDNNLWYFWLFFAVICGIRWNVGVDCVGYMMQFDRGTEGKSMEALWNLLVFAIHKLHLHYTIGMAITAFIQIYFTTKIASKYRYILIFLPIALFGSSYFLGWCNAVRQMMAAAIFVYSTQFILNKKIIPYVLCIFAASLIHHSAQLLYVFYIFAYIHPDKISFSDKRTLTTTIFIVCFILGFTPQFKSFVSFFDFLVESLGDTYSYVGNVIQDTVVEGNNEARAFGPMQLSYFLTALAPIWYGPQLKQEFKDKLPYFDLWWLFSYLYGCGYFLVCNVSFMFTRPFNYFINFQMLIVSLLLCYFYSKQQMNYFKIFVLILWVAVSIDIFKNYGQPWESVTYKMFMFHDLYN